MYAGVILRDVVVVIDLHLLLVPRGFVKSLCPPVDAAFNCIAQRRHIGLQSATMGKVTILLATTVLTFTGPMFNHVQPKLRI